MNGIKTKLIKFSFMALMSSFLGWVYFRSLMSIFFITLAMTILNCFMPKPKPKRNKDLLAFKMLLDGIYTELLIGKSFRNALLESRRHLTFEPQAFIEAVDHLIKDIQLQNQEVMAWECFSNTLDLIPCRQFVEVLKVTYDYGGQVTKVLKHTIKGLTDQMDLELEIDIILSSKKYEFYLMICIPIVLLLLLSYSQYAYMAVLYQTTFGRLIMFFGLVLQVLAYFIGQKIIRIEA